MRRVLAAALLAPTAAVPTAARAADPQVLGGCFFASAPAQVVDGTWEGVLGDRSVTFDSAGLPANATVNCKLQRNGADIPGTAAAFSGFAVQAGAIHLAYTASDVDDIALCERDDVAGGTGTWRCVDRVYGPPETLPDPIVEAFQRLDQTLCPILAQHAGTYPGGVVIEPDGDVFGPDPGLGLNPYEDCPPYNV